ncbi:MAG: PilZ domain-containing protein [Oligoflexia bacterium]|nr:PilZ domain-containing protein [Oligoflexia bacterium]
MKQIAIDQRTVPRFPLPKEKMKFVFEDFEKVFAVRDISLHGLGISLLEMGESLLFPIGYECKAELSLGGAPFLVELRVSRVSAWSVGFIFQSVSDERQEEIQEFLDPFHIGSSMRLVDERAAPEAFFEGLSFWYHGDSGADLFLWNNKRGGVDRALFCLGQDFWEWEDQKGVSTGTMDRLGGSKVVVKKDRTPDPKMVTKFRKILEHMDCLDYRLVSFLRDQT